ncbi:MAG TPA: hypothetical protein VH637_19010 [Streptosporangiaceae bacterium]
MTERQPPLFCPYCGEEDLRPAGPEAGGWCCGACARSFTLAFAGLTRPPAPPPAGGARHAARGRAG